MVIDSALGPNERPGPKNPIVDQLGGLKTSFSVRGPKNLFFSLAYMDPCMFSVSAKVSMQVVI